MCQISITFLMSSDMFIFIFQATDMDSGDYGNVTYSLAGGNDQ